jgi:membrane protein YqaA with SNARE-associated domain
MKALYQWLGQHVHAWYGTMLFGLFVFIEGFFIIPVSTLLAFFCLENRNKALLYASIATVISGLGALVGYGIGMLIWRAGGTAFLYYIINEQKFTHLVEQFTEYQAWTTFIFALTPMPFKLLTITAGFLKLPILPFLLFSMAARGIRFFMIAGLIYIMGDQAQVYVNKYFYWIAISGIVAFMLLWYLMH